MGQSTAPTDERQRAPLFYSEEETAALLGIHRTTLRTLALSGASPVEPIRLTQHKRV